MKALITIIFLSVFTVAVHPQSTGYAVSGKVTDKQSSATIPYATINIKTTGDKFLSGTISNEKGEFTSNPLPTGNYIVECRMMGYKTVSMPFTISGIKNAVGTIALEADATALNEVNISGQRPNTSLQLDKKVFEPGRDMITQNGSVNDILNSVPSVTVSPEGAISLRGNSNVMVMINGRRSGLTQANALDQLQAEQIERVEVITNPSARYDAAGSAGIINIVLKKSKKASFNGQVRVMAGSPNDTRITPSINYKSGKLNIFSTFGLRKSDYVGRYTTVQAANIPGGKSFLNQLQNENRRDDGKLLYGGVDYSIDDKNTITAAYLLNVTRDHDKTRLIYDYNSQQPDSTLLRHGESWENRDYNQFEFNYTQLFTNPKKKFTIDMQYDFWNSDKDWQLSTARTFPAYENLAGIRSNSAGSSKDLVLQSDWVQPVGDNSFFEAGVKIERRSVVSNYIAEVQKSDDWAIYKGIDNQLEYKERISGAYAQLRSKVNRFSYQLGLRTEFTRIDIGDDNHSYADKKRYDRLFPTVHLGYKLDTAGTANLQLSYSKRINRPSLWLIYPFNEVTDLNAQYMGNPALNPSYSDVFELGFLKNTSAFTFNPSVYFQQARSPIIDYVYRDANEIFITTPVNISGETRYGLELSATWTLLKSFQINAEANLWCFRQIGLYNDTDFNFSGRTTTARLSILLKLPGKWSLQGRYNFNSAQSNAQSRRQGMHFADLGLSKSLLADKLNIVADVTNVFNSRQFITRTSGPGYVITQTVNPNAARYRVSLVYKLNMKDNTVRQAKSGNRD
ncbi:TonB-dependent receptor [Mucilaginibacter limnophilus]|uniref:TonB-dependent receptor n=1 Tax=Mucilaginibacter limnophilus TaxID=1932778 RepID=A0A3S2Y2Q4_9SPHI|nr:TonB-dependent receptor [Mucilaginibacter limnophilus]RVU02088.1 TonB-dependent receptor [Mucilaginibacter limnophilus]